MKYLDSLREGMRISEVYLCKNKQIALTKAGKESDSSGQDRHSRCQDLGSGFSGNRQF